MLAGSTSAHARFLTRRLQRTVQNHTTRIPFHNFHAFLEITNKVVRVELQANDAGRSKVLLPVGITDTSSLDLTVLTWDS